MIGLPSQMVFTITNRASGYAYGPWLNQIFVAQDANGTAPKGLGVATFTNIIPPFSSITVTQTVIPPANIFGSLYLGVFVDSGSNLLN